jgi:hypothetical protein
MSQRRSDARTGCSAYYSRELDMTKCVLQCCVAISMQAQSPPSATDTSAVAITSAAQTSVSHDTALSPITTNLLCFFGRLIIAMFRRTLSLTKRLALLSFHQLHRYSVSQALALRLDYSRRITKVHYAFQSQFVADVTSYTILNLPTTCTDPLRTPTRPTRNSSDMRDWDLDLLLESQYLVGSIRAVT